MTSEQKFVDERTAAISPLLLGQIKDAVDELRAATPDSVLAELVEEKIKRLERRSPRDQEHE